ncbi:MAG TPA: hypothetical protein VMR33_06265 [Candidatus Baltobacteraceae bacterium]|nr:hypothetical protein [Candidatus Baltobacteraceae bacterium]
MPESSHFHGAAHMVNSINDTIGPDDDFTNIIIAKLWHDAAKLRKLSENLDARDEKLAKLKRPVRRIKRNVADDVV